MLSIEIQEVLYKIINVYAPNRDGMAIDFFTKVTSILTQENVNEGDNIILGGDLNCILNPLLDKRGGILSPKIKLIKAIENLQTEFLLEDIWRVKNPTVNKLYMEST